MCSVFSYDTDDAANSSVSSEYVDYYRVARDSALSSQFSDYPNINRIEIEVSFQVNSPKSAPLVFAMVEAFPDDCKTVEGSDVHLELASRTRLLENLTVLTHLLSVVRTWKSFSMRCNGASLEWQTYRYLTDYLADMEGLQTPYIPRTKKELSSLYVPTGRRNSKLSPEDSFPKALVSNLCTAAKDIANRYQEIYLDGFAVRVFSRSPYETVLLVEDSLVVDFCIKHQVFDGPDWHMEEYRGSGNSRIHCQIQELTKNDLFRYNNAAFRRSFASGSVPIEFYKFRGVETYREDLDRVSAVSSKYPELRLIERVRAYEGELYHFVVLEMEALDGSIVLGIGYTKGKVHSFVLKICKDLEYRNSRTLELNGLKDNGVPFQDNKDFVQAFLSWKGKSKKWRLENKLSYYYIDIPIRSEAEIWSRLDEVLTNARKGAYASIERGSYSKPSNRWKSEELVYKTVKKLYGDYQVIYQYHPLFLNTGSGSMSYDVYICGLKIAIEYQGIQHFRPVDYFGGAENYQKQVERDELKRKLSGENGITLVYVNYWEDITAALIHSKIEQAISEGPDCKSDATAT